MRTFDKVISISTQLHLEKGGPCQQANRAILRKEIAKTQRLVRQSTKKIHWLAHEYGARHDA